MRVITRNYSTFVDPVTNVQFQPVVVQDRTDSSYGCWIGQAQVTGEQADGFDGRRGFEVLTEAEFAALTQIPALPEPTRPNTGDPITDQSGGDGPPAPPGSDAPITAPTQVIEGANAPAATPDGDEPPAPPSL